MVKKSKDSPLQADKAISAAPSPPETNCHENPEVIEGMMVMNNELLNSQRSLTKENIALVHQEQRFRKVIEENPDPVFVVDKGNRIQFMSAAAHDLRRQCAKDVFDIGSELPFPIPELNEIELETKANGIHTFDLATAATTWDDEPATLVSLRDMTVSRRTRDELVEERNFNESVLQMISSLVIVVDHNGVIQRFNKACESALGYTEAEVTGSVFWERLLVDDQVVSFRDTFFELLAGDLPDLSEIHTVAKNGDNRVLSCRHNILDDRRGEQSHIVFTAVDITDLRSSEKHLSHEMATYEKMRQPVPAKTTAATLGLSPLRTQTPSLFSAMTEDFMAILEQSLEMLILKKDSNVSQQVDELSQKMGAIRAGPRDAIDIFMHAMSRSCENVPTTKCSAYRKEGRLMLIELLGKLTNYYRNHCLGNSLPIQSSTFNKEGGEE